MNRQSNQTTAIYTRVDAPADLQAMECQRKMLQQYAEAQGFQNIVHYSDNGFSGLSFSRPQFVKLMAAVKADQIGALLVSSVDRLTRNGLEAGYLMETIFPEHQVSFYALRDEIYPQSPAMPAFQWASARLGGVR